MFSFFKLLNMISNESFKFEPITSFLKISLTNPSLSLDLFLLRSFNAFSKSFSVHSLLLLFCDNLYFKSNIIFLLNLVGLRSSRYGRDRKRFLNSFASKFFISFLLDTILPLKFFFAVGKFGFCFVALEFGSLIWIYSR